MTKKGFNIYEDCGDYLKVRVINSNGVLKGEILASKEHESLLKKYNWSVFKSRNTAYAHAHIGNSKYIKMHRLIAEVLYGKSNETVDHINQNGLDNRDHNLRYADIYTQMINRGTFADNTSGFKGVSFYNNKWYAEISIRGKKYRQSFTTIEEAIKQREEWGKITIWT